jgi:uncharacterized membrane protein
MSSDAPEPQPVEESSSVLARIQSRVLSGLFLALPLVVAVYVVFFLYTLFRSYVLQPVILGVRYLAGAETWKLAPAWWSTYVSPVLALVLVLTLLYLLGIFAQSKLYGIINRILLRVPIVTPVYQAVLNVFQALETQRKGGQYKRVVLVEFPQPGMRSVGLVTNSLKDQTSGKPILAVCVLTGVMPPSGFTLFVPEESVTDLDWSLNQALQTIVSGGITAPTRIGYDRIPGTGPLIVQTNTQQVSRGE